MKSKLEENLFALKVLHEKLKPIPWVLTGSTSLGLRGVAIEVNDIDILVDLADCPKVYSRLAEFSSAPLQGVSETDKYRSCRNLYEKDGVEVDVMGSFQYRLPGGAWSKIISLADHETITINGMTLRVLPLTVELAEYEAMGRHDKARAIKARLDE